MELRGSEPDCGDPKMIVVSRRIREIAHDYSGFLKAPQWSKDSDRVAASVQKRFTLRTGETRNKGRRRQGSR